MIPPDLWVSADSQHNFKKLEMSENLMLPGGQKEQEDQKTTKLIQESTCSLSGTLPRC